MAFIGVGMLGLISGKKKLQEEFREKWKKIIGQEFDEFKNPSKHDLSQASLQNPELTVFLACCSEDCYEDDDLKIAFDEFPGTKTLVKQLTDGHKVDYSVYEYKSHRVIAFKGTAKAGDVFTDIGLVFGDADKGITDTDLPSKILYAAEAAVKHKATLVTGHSLGGFFAECVASFLELKGASYNAPAPNGSSTKYANGIEGISMPFEVHLTKGDPVSEWGCGKKWTHIRRPIWHDSG